MLLYVYIYIYIVLCIPEVQYSFEPRCSQEINFTCTALGFNSAGISWFAGDTDLATYDFIRTDVYPLPVMTQSINATALIVHANFSTLFNYFNFTLSANITELLPFQGQNFTCGTTSMRSHAIPVPVDNYEVPGKLIISRKINFKHSSNMAYYFLFIIIISIITSDVLEYKWRASLKTILFLYE